MHLARCKMHIDLNRLNLLDPEDRRCCAEHCTHGVMLSLMRNIVLVYTILTGKNSQPVVYTHAGMQQIRMSSPILSTIRTRWHR